MLFKKEKGYICFCRNVASLQLVTVMDPSLHVISLLNDPALFIAVIKQSHKLLSRAWSASDGGDPRNPIAVLGLLCSSSPALMWSALDLPHSPRHSSIFQGPCRPCADFPTPLDPCSPWTCLLFYWTLDLPPHSSNYWLVTFQVPIFRKQPFFYTIFLHSGGRMVLCLKSPRVPFWEQLQWIVSSSKWHLLSWQHHVASFI